MFSNREKPLPQTIHQPQRKQLKAADDSSGGILLGNDCYWHPMKSPNPHAAIIGTSGSGKTQTLLAIASELSRLGDYRIVICDVHGDMGLPGETCYPLNMISAWGVNPMEINLDPEGGGSSMQALVVAETLRRSLTLGTNQHGMLIGLLKECYLNRGILQTNHLTWRKEPPNFADLEEILNQRAEDGDKEAIKLILKLNATFQFGVFNRQQPDWTAGNITRVDMSKLPSDLASVAIEAIALQLFNRYRLAGEDKSPPTWIIIDECKLMYKSPAIDYILGQGRKFNIGAIVASQSERHMSADLLTNTATKVVLQVDQSEVSKVASRFRFDQNKLAKLLPFEALVRIGKTAYFTEIIPYYKREMLS